MFVSRLYIVNYRSIRELDLRFAKGKNIIIGRNNCGKSNIVKALNIILGETSPTYQKSENVTLGDFHSWKETQPDGSSVLRSANELLIWCELTREAGETLDYDELYNCWGFSLAADRNRDPIRYNGAGFPENCDQIFDVTEDSVRKFYVDPKLRNQATFEACFDDKYSFAFAFKAIKSNDDQISKDIRFLFRESNKYGWCLAFKAHVRNQLLQSAIVPSFRDPQSQLRLSSWTWYGKVCHSGEALHAHG